MPIYTCTTTESALPAQTKAALAGEIGAIHSAINHVPSTYVNVVFHDCLPTTSTPTVYRPVQSSSAAGYAGATQKRRPRCTTWMGTPSLSSTVRPEVTVVSGAIWWLDVQYWLVWPK
jgi:phenylpyruvate tautomerase PptA (4-oxalocrotonate tautomerase family)